jgi:3-phosphoshikimate 1-carboxyvinyltransferase
MSNAYRISLPKGSLSGSIVLESSKSISNRALLIRSLCKTPFEISGLSKSDDTLAMQAMLTSDQDTLFSGHAGSSYRFMVARACLGDREVTINASKQLQRRPIGPLVKALKKLGADITYLNKEGFPPLKVKPVKGLGEKVHEITLQAGVSSQYLSALLMIAPLLPKGLTVHLEGIPVSVSYTHMTLSMLQYFGITASYEGHTISVEPGAYTPKDFVVEGDWSAASYFYSMAALAEKAEINIQGLREESIQGDAVVKDIYAQFGVQTEFTEAGIRLSKVVVKEKIKEFRYDFSSCPDIAQTVMVTLGGLGIKGVLTGLKTLKIKETNRLEAMRTELARVKTILLEKEEDGKPLTIITGRSRWKNKGKFDTYEDHRMAMALTPYACLNQILIKDIDVVSKSYPGFWQDVAAIGMTFEKVKIK